MLDRLQDDPRYRVVGLITMITAGDRRISMHGVSNDLLSAQAEAVGLPLVQAEIPAFPENAIYEAAFARAVDRFRSLGVRTVAFGDLFLADVRQYREQLCARIGLEALFPLWGENTSQLAAAFLARGYQATVCCADAAKLPREMVGCGYHAEFLARLPAEVDPCGENGEFHTFVTAGPILSTPIHVDIKAVTSSKGFWYAELQTPRTGPGRASNLEHRPRRAAVKESAHV